MLLSFEEQRNMIRRFELRDLSVRRRQEVVQIRRQKVVQTSFQGV